MKFTFLLASLLFAQTQVNPPTSLIVTVNGVSVQNVTSLNINNGTGIIVVCSPAPCSGPTLNLSFSVNSALFPTLNQALSINTCTLTSQGSTDFACTMSWAKAQIQPTWFWFTPDTTPTGPAWINVDGLATGVGTSIKQKDGSTDPGSNLVAGRPALLYWNKTVYLQMI